MKTKLLAMGAAIALSLGMAAPASALTWVTQMEWTDAGGTTAVASKATVTAVDQDDGKSVIITVDLLDLNAGVPRDRIIDTGAHWAFTWNLTDVAGSTVELLSPTGGTNPFVYQTPVAAGFTQTGAFGQFTNAFACCGPGSNNGKTSLSFKVSNEDGLTFAGDGATQNDDNTINYGTGNRFASNTSGSLLGGKWWFAMDIFDGPGGTGPGATYVIAGRDAICQDGAACDVPDPPCLTCGGVPEPDAWALMILGFGSVGAALRSRRWKLS